MKLLTFYFCTKLPVDYDSYKEKFNVKEMKRQLEKWEEKKKLKLLKG